MGGGQSKQTKSKKPAGEVSNIDRAVLDLKVSRDRLTRYKKKLSLDSDKLLAKARSLKHSNETKSALGLLKLRKMKQKEVDNIDSQLISIQTMVSNIQTKEQETEVLTALRSGKSALEKLHNENTLEDVLQLMEEIEEQNDMEKEINDVLVNTGETLTGIEEDELELELQALMGGTGTITDSGEDKVNLPEVPTSRLPEVTEVEAQTAVVKEKPARFAMAS